MDEVKEGEVNVNLNLDTTPILYTDNVLITVNEDGVVLDACQKVGSSNQVRIVARVGMSKTHAQKLVKALNDLVEKSEGQVHTTKKVHQA